MAASNHLRGSTVQPRQLPASNSRRARLLVAQSKITGAKVGARTCDDTRDRPILWTQGGQAAPLGLLSIAPWGEHPPSRQFIQDKVTIARWGSTLDAHHARRLTNRTRCDVSKRRTTRCARCVGEPNPGDWTDGGPIDWTSRVRRGVARFAGGGRFGSEAVRPGASAHGQGGCKEGSMGACCRAWLLLQALTSVRPPQAAGSGKLDVSAAPPPAFSSGTARHAWSQGAHTGMQSMHVTSLD